MKQQQLTEAEIMELTRKNIVYNFFDFTLINDLYKKGHIEKTPVKYRGKLVLSIHSLMFSYDFLVDGYIKNNNLYEKYKEAMSGSGQSGYNKFAPIHSSSLFPFLIFSLVNKDNKLKIPSPQLKGVEFNDVIFEYKNKVFNSPSNIDVLLIGEKERKKVFLFLECKFSEYLSTNRKVYSVKYKEAFDRYLPENIRYNNINEGLQLVSDEPIYLDGIKQMIHHYIAISNFTNNIFYEANYNTQIASEYEVNSDNIDIFFGEMVFDFKKDFSNNKLENYQKNYSKLKDLLKDNKKITLLDNLLLYQDLFNYNGSAYFNKLDDVFKKLYEIDKQIKNGGK